MILEIIWWIISGFHFGMAEGANEMCVGSLVAGQCPAGLHPRSMAGPGLTVPQLEAPHRKGLCA